MRPLGPFLAMSCGSKRQVSGSLLEDSVWPAGLHGQLSVDPARRLSPPATCVSSVPCVLANAWYFQSSDFELFLWAFLISPYTLLCISIVSADAEHGFVAEWASVRSFLRVPVQVSCSLVLCAFFSLTSSSLKSCL